MIQWVLDAINGSSMLNEIFIVGLTPDVGLVSRKPIHYIDDHGGALDNVIAGTKVLVENRPGTDRFLMVSSDIPALTTEMVEWVLDQASQQDLDITYFTISREVMEARYPESHRTFTRFQDVALCAADIFMMRASSVLNPSGRWRNLLDARKSPLKQASIIGFDILLLMLLRRIKMEKAVKIIVKRLGLTGRVCFTPYAEMGMDVDKAFQLDIIRQDLSRKHT